MPAPKKKIMGKGESIVGGVARGGASRGGAARKALVKVKPKPDTKAEPRSNVKTRRSVSSNWVRQGRNKAESEYLKDVKSGRTARVKAEDIKERMGKATKKPTIKITGK